MSDTVSAASIVAILAPYAVSLMGAVIAAAVAFAARTFTRWTHIQIEHAALDKVTAAAQSEAGALVAAAADNLATTQIPVGSPIVADIVVKLAGAMPADLAAAGLTPDRVAVLVAGEIGKLQARMTSATAPAKP